MGIAFPILRTRGCQIKLIFFLTLFGRFGYTFPMMPFKVSRSTSCSYHFRQVNQVQSVVLIKQDVLAKCLAQQCQATRRTKC